jgi:hypothetical protein
MSQPANAFARLAALTIGRWSDERPNSIRSHRRHKRSSPGNQFDDDCHITQSQTTPLAEVSGPLQSPKAGRQGCPSRGIETVGNERAHASPSGSFGAPQSAMEEYPAWRKNVGGISQEK